VSLNCGVHLDRKCKLPEAAPGKRCSPATAVCPPNTGPSPQLGQNFLIYACSVISCATSALLLDPKGAGYVAAAEPGSKLTGGEAAFLSREPAAQSIYASMRRRTYGVCVRHGVTALYVAGVAPELDGKRE